LKNILVDFEDDTILEDFVQSQNRNIVLQKNRDDGYTVYKWKYDFGDIRPGSGPRGVKIADFGNAERVNESDPQFHPIQIDCSPAPEVILGTGWGRSADIWNLGMLVSVRKYGSHHYIDRPADTVIAMEHVGRCTR
jgi:serine/threonine protein kinase